MKGPRYAGRSWRFSEYRRRHDRAMAVPPRQGSEPVIRSVPRRPGRLVPAPHRPDPGAGSPLRARGRRDRAVPGVGSDSAPRSGGPETDETSRMRAARRRSPDESRDVQAAGKRHHGHTGADHRHGAMLIPAPRHTSVGRRRRRERRVDRAEREVRLDRTQDPPSLVPDGAITLGRAGRRGRRSATSTTEGEEDHRFDRDRAALGDGPGIRSGRSAGPPAPDVQAATGHRSLRLPVQ